MSSSRGQKQIKTLAREGKKVIATMRDLSKGDDIREVANEEGLSIEIRQLDVCDPEMVQNCLEDAQEIEA